MEGTRKDNSQEYDLKLFISGASRNSTKAIKNLQRILENNFAGSYKLQIIDIYQDKALAQSEQIVAVPLLIRKGPKPEQRLIGDMSDEEKVINTLKIILEL